MDLLEEKSLLGCRSTKTPIEPNLKLQVAIEEEVKDKEKYQRRGQFEEVYRILRYLKGTPRKGILFRNMTTYIVEIYSDVDGVGSTTDRRSTSNYYSFVGGHLVAGRSEKTKAVARSSAEEEFRDLAHDTYEGIWINKIKNY